MGLSSSAKAERHRKITTEIHRERIENVPHDKR